MSFEQLREIRRFNNEVPDDPETLDWRPALDTTTAPAPIQYPGGDEFDNVGLLDARDPAVPIDTATAKTPGLLLAQLLAERR